MTRRPTSSEMIWPDTPDDAQAAISWAIGVSTQVLSWMWRSFDTLRLTLLYKVDFSAGPEQVERDLTRNHFVEIQILFASETRGYASFVPVYEWPELETRSTPRAKPPAYDFAFVYSANRRWAWPVEAKVVSSPEALSDYMKDVNDKFLGSVAAPLIGEGAMIAYLLSCEGAAVLDGIEARLRQQLGIVPDFVERAHKFSTHTRGQSPNLRLHHMMMRCD